MDRRTFFKRVLAAGVMAMATAGGIWKYKLDRNAERTEPGSSSTDEGGAAGDGAVAAIGNPNDASGALFSFMILSDLHINGGASEQSEKFRHTLDDMLAFESKIETIVITGDITDPLRSGITRSFAAS